MWRNRKGSKDGGERDGWNVKPRPPMNEILVRGEQLGAELHASGCGLDIWGTIVEGIARENT